MSKLDLTRYEGHTEGPWGLEEGCDGEFHVAVGMWPVGETICHGIASAPNGNLIAAAPAILAKLREAVGLLREVRVTTEYPWNTMEVEIDAFLATIETGEGGGT